MGKSKYAALEDAIIRALLTCDTLSAAAKEAGVSRSTVYDKLHDPAFVERYEAERKQVNAIIRDTIAEHAAEAALSAIAALKTYTEGRNMFVDDKDRIRASEALLECYGRTFER